MAGLLPSFLSAAQLEIRIGGAVLAYCQNISWTDDMTTIPVGGIGSYSYHAIEPVGYAGRGSMTITHYSGKVFNLLKKVTGGGALPANMANTSVSDAVDGNSLLTSEFFNPVTLLLSRTFDVRIYERNVAEVAAQDITKGPSATNDSTLIYTLQNCRMTNLAFTFTPGSLINQVVTFLCMSVVDAGTESEVKITDTP